MDAPINGWRDGFDRISRQCWSDNKDHPQMRHARPTSLQWTWDEEWLMHSNEADNPLVDCISQGGDLIPEPQTPIDVTLYITLEGVAP